MRRIGFQLICGLGAAWLAGGVLSLPSYAQNLQNIAHSRSRIFPGVSSIIAMREDDSGHYYILSAPGFSVLIFDASGNQIGQIPNSHSNGATIRYGVDLDLTSTGDLVVADRGGNAIEVFGPDGSFREKINVFAPTSVVALANGQFGVTTLRTNHPVEIIDDQGRVVRGFGDPARVGIAGPSNPEISFAPGVSNPTQESPELADLGRVVGDSEDHLYFAKISTDASSKPEIRKYDRFGYVAYAAELPTPASDPDPSVLDDRVQFSFGFTRLSRSDQETEYTTIGDSGKVQVTSGVGTGLSGMLGGRGAGGSGMRGGVPMAGGGFGPAGLGFEEASAPTIGRGGLSGTVTGEGSLKDASMHLHLGLKANQPRAGAAASNSKSSGQSSAQSAQQNTQDPNASNAALLYGTSNYFSDADADADDNASADAVTLQFQPESTNATDQNYASFAPASQPDLIPGPLMGASPGFFLGGLGPRPGFGGGRRDFGGLGGFAGTRSMEGPPTGAAAFGSRPPEQFSPRGRFGASTFDFVGSIRINLDRRPPAPAVERSVTAVGIDRQNEEIWAAVGSMLVHFDKNGSQLDTYYLTTPEGAAFRATAILVEPNRLVIASDARGIYDFPRPDRTGSLARPQ